MITDKLKSRLFFRNTYGSPYSRGKEWKAASFRETLINLTRHHIDNCEIYRNILAASNFVLNEETRVDELPFLPTGLFKYLTLASVPLNKIKRTLTSSGTSRQTVSRIYLDNETSILQMQALAIIISEFLGKERLPLLVVDHALVLQDHSVYSARAAGIQGFSLFGHDRTFALTEEMQPDLDQIQMFLEKVDGERFFMFGFTYIIWKNLLQYLDRKGVSLDFRQAILIHGGGWKRMSEQQVTDERFRSLLQDITGLTKVYNYYGMMEQTGSIFMQCETGYLHCSSFSEVFMRRAEDFSICDYGEPGIIQVISMLPYSYPGHNLLTEDEGILHGEDDCPCGRHGKYFCVTRRLVNADLKGCGDVNTGS